MSTNEPIYPQQMETCVICDAEDRKRNALLFDRVHAWAPDSGMVTDSDIPEEVVFRIPELDEVIIKETSAEGGAVLYGAPIGFNYASSRRNLVEEYSRRGIGSTPTYNSRLLFSWDFKPGQKLSYEAALNNIPQFSDDSVEWNQILEFRSDKEARRKYRDLRHWLLYVLQCSSVDEATELIAQRIEDYAWSLRKHGLKTALGTFTQMFDWKQSALTIAAAGVAGTVGGPALSAIVSGTLVAAKVGASLIERRIDLGDVERGPGREVAILYDIRNEFGGG